jgi:hypothetical protein
MTFISDSSSSPQPHPKSPFTIRPKHTKPIQLTVDFDGWSVAICTGAEFASRDAEAILLAVDFAEKVVFVVV